MHIKRSKSQRHTVKSCESNRNHCLQPLSICKWKVRYTLTEASTFPSVMVLSRTFFGYEGKTFCFSLNSSRLNEEVELFIKANILGIKMWDSNVMNCPRYAKDFRNQNFHETTRPATNKMWGGGLGFCGASMCSSM